MRENDFALRAALVQLSDLGPVNVTDEVYTDPEELETCVGVGMRVSKGRPPSVSQVQHATERLGQNASRADVLRYLLGPSCDMEDPALRGRVTAIGKAILCVSLLHQGFHRTARGSRGQVASSAKRKPKKRSQP